MARIKEPTLAEYMGTCTQAFRHLQNVKKIVLNKLAPVLKSWQEENFPNEGATIYMNGDKVEPVEDSPVLASNIKFKFTDDGRTVILFYMRMGNTGNRFPFKYDGNALSQAYAYAWGSPSEVELSPQQLELAQNQIKGFKEQHKSRVELARDCKEGQAVPKLMHLLHSIDAGEFKDHKTAFNSITWDTYVSGRSKKSGQLTKSVSVALPPANDIAQEMARLKRIEEIKGLFEGTRYKLVQTTQVMLSFAPCELPNISESRCKVLSNKYLQSGGRRLL